MTDVVVKSVVGSNRANDSAKISVNSLRFVEFEKLSSLMELGW